MSEEKTAPDLSDLITGGQDDDAVDVIGKSIESLNDSIASMHIYVRTLDQRLSSIERHVAYLLEKDPVVGAKIQEHLSKMEQEMKAMDGNEAK